MAEQRGDEWLLRYYTAEKADGGRTQRIVVEPADGAAQHTVAPGLSRCPPGKYAGGDSLGEGGMKVVVSVADRDTGRTVARAAPRREGEAPSDDDVRRFVREARITAGLEHPNIVPVYDMGLDEAGAPYFTMKRLTGETLHSILKKRRAGDAACLSAFGLPRMLEVFQGICNGVAYAHSKGFVHLDLKPSNIQISDFQEVLILDWGLARRLGGPADGGAPGAAPESDWSASDPVSLHGTVQGTPGFMAPEQAAGEPSSCDQRTDVYALGAILYAMLTGVPPTDDASLTQVLSRTRAGHVVPPSGRVPGVRVPRALEAVVMKAMASDPAARYATVNALRRDVQAFVNGYATSAQDVGLLHLAVLLVGRHKTLATTIGGTLLLVLLLTAGFVVRLRASERVAVTALRQLRAEHAEKLRLGCLATPRMLGEAEAELRAGRYEAAQEQLGVVVGLNTGSIEAWAAKGLLHAGRLQFAAAADAWAHLPRKRAPAAEGLESGDRPGRDKRPKARAPGPPLDAVARDFDRRTRGGARLPDDADVMELLGALQAERNALPAAYRAAAQQALFTELAARQAPVGDAYLALVASALNLLNPAPAAHPPAFVREGDALALDLSTVPRIRDITPLGGLPLRHLDLARTSVQDLAPLRGMPLVELDLARSDVRDLAPLAGLPVRDLDLTGCERVRVQVLDQMPNLARVVLPARLAQSETAELLRERGVEIVVAEPVGPPPKKVSPGAH